MVTNIKGDDLASVSDDPAPVPTTTTTPRVFPNGPLNPPATSPSSITPLTLTQSQGDVINEFAHPGPPEMRHHRYVFLLHLQQGTITLSPDEQASLQER